MTITIELSVEQAARLDALAAAAGVGAADLARQQVVGLIEQQPTFASDAAFREAADYVLAKNAELYRRLSK